MVAFRISVEDAIAEGRSTVLATLQMRTGAAAKKDTHGQGRARILAAITLRLPHISYGPAGSVAFKINHLAALGLQTTS
jgi:hypothetical protein